MTCKAMLEARPADGSEPVHGRMKDLLLCAAFALVFLFCSGHGLMAQEAFAAVYPPAQIAFHIHMAGLAGSLPAITFDPQPRIVNRPIGTDPQTLYLQAPKFGGLDLPHAYSEADQVVEGDRFRFEPHLVVNQSGYQSRIVRFVSSPNRVWSKAAAWYSAHTELRSTSWRQWPIRFLMASVDQFQFSFPSRASRLVSHPDAATTGRRR